MAEPENDIATAIQRAAEVARRIGREDIARRLTDIANKYLPTKNEPNVTEGISGRHR
jgi:hypothetical protein